MNRSVPAFAVIYEICGRSESEGPEGEPQISQSTQMDSEKATAGTR